MPGQRTGPGGAPCSGAITPTRPTGLPTEINDSLRGRRVLGVDSAGRPTSVTAANWNEAYAYDALGNLARATTPTTPGTGKSAGATTDAADADGDREIHGTRVARAGRVTYHYDAAGRVVRQIRRTLSGQSKTWTYTWDADDRLVQAATPEGRLWHYTYDPLGRRLAKESTDAAGTRVTVVFAWDGPRLAEEERTDGRGRTTTLTWDYVPSSFTPATQTRRTWAATAAQHEIDTEFHAIVADLVGAPSELVAPNGTIAWRANRTVWGRTTPEHGGSTSCPLGFPGQYHDPETGLYYNLNRYYNPDTASYLTADPLGLAPAANHHTYVSNPLVLIDPLGLACEGNGANPGGSGATTQIFRNVDGREFDSIATTGKFGTGAGQMEGKWFATTGAHADQWGDVLNGGQGVTVETRIPSSLPPTSCTSSRANWTVSAPVSMLKATNSTLINKSMDGIRLW